MPIDTVFASFPVLDTNRLYLRQVVASDADALYAVLSDEETCRFYDDDPYTAVSQARNQIQSWQRGYENKFAVRLAIVMKEEKTLIGTCGFYGFHYYYQKATIGYELHRNFWLQGIMTEALGALLKYGFEILELNRIDALIMPGNIASIKLLEKQGFQNEGLLKQYERWGRKGFVDLYLYALLQSEYPAL